MTTPLGTVTLERRDAVLIAGLTGEVDVTNAEGIQGEIEQAATGDVTRLVIDLSRLQFLDSSGIRALIWLARQIEARGAAMRVFAPDGSPLWRILEITRMEEIIPVTRTLEEAVAGG